VVAVDDEIEKSSSLPNFVSAFVFGLAAIVVMAGNII
jgi:hypothetical protein